jgi:tetratricopeptide (TPR) repeat protein
MAELGNIKRKVAELEAKGDTEKAIGELEKAIQEFPKEGSLFNKLGDLYIKANRQQNALEIYEKGATVFKEETYYPNAIALCKKILRLDKERAEVYQLLGELHKELGQKVEAANYLLEFAERKMQAHELEAALSTYNTVKDLVPNNAKILQTISAIYAQLGKQDQKDKLLQEAHEIENKQRELKETFTAKTAETAVAADVKLGVKPPEPPAAELPPEEVAVKTPGEVAAPPDEKQAVALDEFVSPEIAELLKTESEETVATPTVELPETTNPPVTSEVVTPAEVIEAPVIKEEEKEQVPAAELAAMPEISEIDKTVELAELYLNLGSEEEAIDCFRNAADDAFRDNLFDKALALNRRVAGLRPLDLKSRQYMIEIAKKQEDKGLQINSLLELAEALNRREAKTEAQAIFKKILELDPNNATAHSMIVEVEQPRDFIDLGEVLRTELEGEKHAEGIQNINELISQFKKEVFESIGEGDYRSHYDLGVAYKGMSLYQEAIEEFEIASKDPGLRLKTCEMIGSCLLDKGKFDDAIRVLSDGLKITNHPAKEYFGIHFLMGSGFESLNNLNMALKSYWNAYNIDKTVPDLAKKINHLKERVTAELKKKGAKPEPPVQPAAPSPKVDAKKTPEPQKAAPKKSKVTYL